MHGQRSFFDRASCNHYISQPSEQIRPDSEFRIYYIASREDNFQERDQAPLHIRAGAALCL